MSFCSARGMGVRRLYSKGGGGKEHNYCLKTTKKHTSKYYFSKKKSIKYHTRLPPDAKTNCSKHSEFCMKKIHTSYK